MKFKNYIETESGIKDTSTSPGTAGQLLSSTVTGTEWIDQSTISSGTSEVVDIQVKNISSADGGINLSKGDPVYIYGSVGASPRLYIDLADADSTATNNLGDGKMPCVGLLDQDLIPNQEGTATVVGKLRNLITNPIGGNIPSENDTVYVKSGGGLTLLKPTGSTNLIQNVGQVGRVSTSADGNIVVAALLRSNDVPNLTTGKIWVGSAANTTESTVVHLDETNERMGIGTTSPQEPLHVYSTGAGPVRVEIESTQAADSVVKYTNSVRSYGTFLTQSGQFSIYDYNAASHRFYMLTNGNIGIGTTSPQSKLHVANGTLRTWTPTSGTSAIFESTANNRNFLTLTAANEAELWFGNASIQTLGRVRYEMSTNNMEFWTNGSQKMVIEGGGDVGIGTTSPSSQVGSTKVLDISSNGNGEIILDHTDAGSSSDLGLYSWNRNNDHLAHIKASCDGATDSAFISLHTQATGGSFSNPSSNERMRITSDGNVGIGTTSPNSKLQVDGEIDANGGDGYRINGKPWAAESSNILRLGDWDGEGFSTSIFDENSVEIVEVKDSGVTINCDRTSTTTYGSDASLVVGGNKFSPYGAGVLTLLNNDPISQASDSTGLIQFAIRDDQNTSAGYTSASIKGSIDFAAGSGSSGGGVLDFLTSTGGLGSSPTTRMRIDRLGNVGIGTTSVLAKLHVNGGIKLANDTDSPSATKAGTFRYYTSGNNSYVDMCMQTGASTYAWVNIVTNSW